MSSKKLIFEKLDTQQQINKFEKNFPAGRLESMKLAMPITLASDYLVMAPERFFQDELKSGRIKVIEVSDFDLILKLKLVTRSKEIMSPLEVEMVACLEKARDNFVGA